MVRAVAQAVNARTKLEQLIATDPATGPAARKTLIQRFHRRQAVVNEQGGGGVLGRYVLKAR